MKLVVNEVRARVWNQAGSNLSRQVRAPTEHKVNSQVWVKMWSMIYEPVCILVKDRVRKGRS